MNLQGKVAIVTGGSKGIGKAIAMELASNGVKVVINYNSSHEKAEKLVDEMISRNYQAIAIKADVSDSEQASYLINETVSEFGRLDILVNNAGITRDRSFKKMKEEAWKEVIDVNLNTVFHTTSCALSHLVNSGNGRVINISSIIAQAGGFGQTNYAAAKAGMIGFTKSLALELAKTGVTVNAVCPGFIETDMLHEVPDHIRESIQAEIPSKRFGHAEEIARGVVYLCKDGEYITGQQLNINGGLYM